LERVQHAALRILLSASHKHRETFSILSYASGKPIFPSSFRAIYLTLRDLLFSSFDIALITSELICMVSYSFSLIIWLNRNRLRLFVSSFLNYAIY
jgi:hypothetical protein